ncbi:hypothetical protein EVAR_28034_1 [Eumeta japonica]|uniref:Uncharacterized protein n=1 Tax=Eumeta variegata TaxID=151549 RepID=A0A4C1W4K0_EUMVA|nr:hypothetical protein EVAR_28034_1 [Eumeta japonica]
MARAGRFHRKYLQTPGPAGRGGGGGGAVRGRATVRASLRDTVRQRPRMRTRRDRNLEDLTVPKYPKAPNKRRCLPANDQGLFVGNEGHADSYLSWNSVSSTCPPEIRRTPEE